MTRGLVALMVAVGFGSASVAQEPLPATTYALAADQSDLYVVVRNDTSALMSGLGHDHVVYASAFDGQVTWPAASGGPCSVAIQVPVRSLVVDPPGLRDRAGLDDNTISDDDKLKLSKNMWGSSQLAADEHPNVTFRADTCPGGTGKVAVEGTLTIRGVARPASVTMDVRSDGSTFSGKGTLETTHTAFGFKPFAATAFGPRNQDRLTLVIAVRGRAP